MSNEISGYLGVNGIQFQRQDVMRWKRHPMALEEYKRKRHFDRTPEPPADKPQARQGFSYLIQKHDATRLHYDLRLELDGVLLSWAVTKGPSLDPADKRLAVHTEDHPLSYGTFEGTIPEGEYGGGTVMLWDRGSWEPEGEPHAALKKGHLAFILHGERLTGGWDLVRMGKEGKKENWLLIKKRDEAARSNGAASNFLAAENTSVTTKRSMDEIALDAPPSEKDGKAGNKLNSLLKEYSAVQLATLVDRPPEGDQWLHEIKFDGYRLLAFLADGTVRLITRNGNDWTRKFPAIHASVAKLKADTAVLDMEAVVLDSGGQEQLPGDAAGLGRGRRCPVDSGLCFRPAASRRQGSERRDPDGPQADSGKASQKIRTGQIPSLQRPRQGAGCGHAGEILRAWGWKALSRNWLIPAMHPVARKAGSSRNASSDRSS